MIDATISRARLRDLARLGRFTPRLRRSHGTNHLSLEQAFDVFREYVGLEVDRVARAELAERRLRERVRDERDGEARVVEVRDREARALDRDRALLDDMAEEARRCVDPHPAPVALLLDGADGA